MTILKKQKKNTSFIYKVINNHFVIIFLQFLFIFECNCFSLDNYYVNKNNYPKKNKSYNYYNNKLIQFNYLSPKSKFFVNKNNNYIKILHKKLLKDNKELSKVFISLLTKSIRLFKIFFSFSRFTTAISNFNHINKNNLRFINYTPIDKNLKIFFWNYMHDSKIIFIDDYSKVQSEKIAGELLKKDIMEYKSSKVPFEQLYTELPQAIEEVHSNFNNSRLTPIKKWLVFGGMMNLCISTIIKAILKNDGSNNNSYSTHHIIIPLFAINKDHGYLQGFNDYTNNDVIPRELIIYSYDGLLTTEPNEFFNEIFDDGTPKDPKTYISIPFPKGDGVTLRKDGIEIKKFNPKAKRQTIIDFFTNQVSMYVNVVNQVNQNEQFSNIRINDLSEKLNYYFITSY